VRALVTGPTGFLGRHLVATLEAAGIDCLGLARRAPAAGTLGCPVEVVDLTDAARVAALVDDFAPTHVFHMAGSLRRPGMPPEALIDANVALTEALMSVVAARDPAPIVVVPGSAAVYGRPEVLPITETHPIAPLDGYGASKAAQEIVVERHHRGSGCPIRILRIFNLVGPGQPTALLASSIAHQIVAAEHGGPATIEVGNLAAKRDLVDVRDAAAAALAAACAPGPRIVLNVCSGRSTSMLDVADLLVARARVPVEVIQQSSRLRPHDVPDHVGDPTLARETIGWSPRVAIETSLVDCLDFWRADENAPAGAQGRA